MDQINRLTPPLTERADEKVQANNPTESLATDRDFAEYPSGFRRYAIGFILGFSIVLPMLDISILSTALPTITDEFNSLEDIGWYGSAYLMATSMAQLPWGKAYSIFSPLSCFLAAIVLFEIGSIVSATAQSSTALIIGRGISGAGDSGVWAGSLCMIAYAFPLRQRPAVSGAIATLSVGATVLGPPLGGVFVTKASWRWCFAINPIIGVPTFIASVLTLRAIKFPKRDSESLWGKVKRFDWLGLAFLLPSIVCLLMALQWGGTRYSWSSARIVVLLVLAAALIAIFVLIQWKKEEEAMLPLRILQRRTVATSAAYGFAVVASGETLSYYAPSWFQASKGVDALQSGVMTLPLAAATCLCSILGGILVTKIGHYVPFMILGSVTVLTGAVLFTRFETDTGAGLWAPTISLIGAGIGLGSDLPQVAVQTVLNEVDLPLGIGVAIFAQTLGQSIFISVIGNIVNNELLAGFRKELPNINTSDVLNAGATELQSTVGSQYLGVARHIYNQAITRSFYACVAMAALSLIIACTMEWNSVKDEVGGEGEGASVPHGTVNDELRASQHQADV